MDLKRALLLATVALAAIACTAPAAQADVYLTDEGQTLGAGAKLTATSTNFVTTRPNATKIECTEAVLHLELIDPGPEHLELEQLGPATFEHCTLNREALGLGPLPITVDDGTAGVGENNILTIDTWGTGTTNYTFVSTIFADAPHTILAAACDFAGTLDIDAVQTADELKVTPSKLTDPTCGEATAEGDFTLETVIKHEFPPQTTSVPIVTHYEETP